jgi:hypothetical protein
MADFCKNPSGSLSSPASCAFASPSDDGTVLQNVPLTQLPPDAIYPLRRTLVPATDTAAADIVGLY